MATFDIGTRVKVIGQDITGKIISQSCYLR